MLYKQNTFSHGTYVTSKGAELSSKKLSDSLLNIIIIMQCRQHCLFYFSTTIKLFFLSKEKTNILLTHFFRKWVPIEIGVFLDLSYQSVIAIIVKSYLHMPYLYKSVVRFTLRDW